jgi:hypothetical protein
MGSAPQLLRDRRWTALLRQLTPRAHARAALVTAALPRRAGVSAACMRALENSPVVAAFGVASDLARGAPAGVSHAPVAVEWDVYLSAEACAAVDAAGGHDATRGAHGDALAARVVATTAVAHGSLVHVLLERVCGLSMHRSILQRSGNMTVPAWLRAYFHALAAGAPAVHVVAAGSPPRPLLSVFLDVKSRGASPAALRALVDGLNAMGVHVWGVGSFVHAQLGEARGRREPQRIAVPDVAAGGGLDAGSADAARRAGWESGSSGVAIAVTAPPAPTHRRRAPSSEEAVQEVELALRGHTPLVAPEDDDAAASPGLTWLQRRMLGAHRWDEAAPEVAREGGAAAEGTDGAPLPLVALSLPPPLPFYLFSFVGDIQRLVEHGALPDGAHVLFNGGTMLTASRAVSTGGGGGSGDGGGSEWTYKVQPALLDELGELVRAHGLQLGYYTQEPALDAAAAEELTRVANQYPALFPHGFAYSGPLGAVAGDVLPAARSPATGVPVPWLLAPFVGTRWRFRG